MQALTEQSTTETRRRGENQLLGLSRWLSAKNQEPKAKKASLRASVSPWWVLFFLAAATVAKGQITFRDITAQAGIHFTHNNGAFGKKWLPETMGPGCAFIDYDNDG